MKNVLKVYRIAKDMTQEDLAKLLKVSRSTVQNMERGVHDPESPTLLKIAHIFNEDIRKIFFLDTDTLEMPNISKITAT